MAEGRVAYFFSPRDGGDFSREEGGGRTEIEENAAEVSVGPYDDLCQSRLSTQRSSEFSTKDVSCKRFTVVCILIAAKLATGHSRYNSIHISSG